MFGRERRLDFGCIRFMICILCASPGGMEMMNLYVMTVFRIKDLSPGCMYAVTFCAMLGDIKGNNSPPTNFSTLPAEPEAPASPRAMSKTRSSIQVCGTIHYFLCSRFYVFHVWCVVLVAS